MKNLIILGSTGSIGVSTLNIVRRYPEKFHITALAAGHNRARLKEQIEEFHPKRAYIISQEDAAALRQSFPQVEFFWGDGMEEFSRCTDFDLGVSAMVGIAGLRPTYNMICSGKTVALANKEVLVTGGSLVMEAAKQHGAQLVTIDSEHSAIMQCLRGEDHGSIDRILLTASGGPFFDKPLDNSITPEQALAHPTWHMGPKISIDSATMMNKGFEVIEARWLFDVPPERVQVVVHRQSLVHSMVQFTDGTIMANIAPTSMEIPIAYALDYPNRLPNNEQKLDLFAIGSLRFERPDLNKFACLRLALQATAAGHSHQVVLNSANEVLVAAFLSGKIPFLRIPQEIERALERHSGEELHSVDEILALDDRIRRETRAAIGLLPQE